MNFKLRAFPLTGSDPKRSNQDQEGQEGLLYDIW